MMKKSIYSQVLALAVLSLTARADDDWDQDWWNGELGHECHLARPCEDSTYYYNELACECFKIEICPELGCDFGLERDPR